MTLIVGILRLPSPHALIQIKPPQAGTGRQGRDGDMFSNFAGLDLAALPSIARGEARSHVVPRIVATAETLRGYATPVADFAAGAVTIVTWPQPGWRPIVAGTGNEGGGVEGRFGKGRPGEGQHAVNHAVGGRYVTGRVAAPAAAAADPPAGGRSRVFTHHARYHPA